MTSRQPKPWTPDPKRTGSAQEQFSDPVNVKEDLDSMEEDFEDEKEFEEMTENKYVINQLICSKEVQKIAEVQFPMTLLPGVEIGPSGSLVPLIQLQPNLSGIVQTSTIIKDRVINVGYLPANVVILGATTPITVSLPFSQITDCPGARPEDQLIETALQPEAIIIQPVPTTVVGVNLASLVLLKVILKTRITVLRPIIAKIHDVVPLQALHPSTPETPALVPTIQRPATSLQQVISNILSG
jgi:hypothetical protein